MTLTDLLTNIAQTKAYMKQKLGTSSDALDQYPTLITNFLYTQYNNGYKAGWKSIKGTEYSGNKKTLLTVSTTVPSWQGQDTTQLSTLTNVMSGIADIRVAMKNALGITTNVFSQYPSYLTVTSSHNSTSRADQEYQLGYTAGVQDATDSSTPSITYRVSKPIFQLVTDNVINISSSDATSLKYWVSNSLAGEPLSGTTTTIASSSTQYNVTYAYDGKYLCAIGMRSGYDNSYTTSGQMTYVSAVTPDIPVVEIPDAPEITVDQRNNKIYITQDMQEDVVIVYTTNGGTSWTDAGAPFVELLIPPRGINAGNLQAYCYFEDDPDNHSATYSYPERIDYYIAPVEPDEPEEDMSAVPFYIYFTNTNSSSSDALKMTVEYSSTPGQLIYVYSDQSLTNWVAPTVSGTKYTFLLSPKRYYYLVKNPNYTLSSTKHAPTFTFDRTTANITFGGNLLSLVEGANFANSTLTTLPDSCFANYFNNATFKTAITDVSKLYFPLGGKAAFQKMFYQCTALEYGPSIDALTIGPNGCASMFYGCTALKKVGDIAATTIGASGCSQMFYQCSNLVTGPSELKPTTLTSSCYYEMFDTCKKLKEAPKILATDISADSCMKWMFYNCAALETINICFTTWPTNSNQTYDWCAQQGTFSSEGVFEIEGEGTWNVADHTGTSGIPTGWLIDDIRDMY